MSVPKAIDLLDLAMVQLEEARLELLTHDCKPPDAGATDEDTPAPPTPTEPQP